MRAGGMLRVLLGQPNQPLDHGARGARVSSNVTNGTIRGSAINRDNSLPCRGADLIARRRGS